MIAPAAHVDSKAKLPPSSILCFDFRHFRSPACPLVDTEQPEPKRVRISNVDLQFPVAREPAPDRCKRFSPDTCAAVLRHDIELGDLPNGTGRRRAANQRETYDRALLTNEEWMSAGFGKVRVQIRIVAPIGRAGS